MDEEELNYYESEHEGSEIDIAVAWALQHQTVDVVRLKEDFDAETVRGKAYEASLSGRITTEKNRATNAEAELQNNITTLQESVNEKVSNYDFSEAVQELNGKIDKTVAWAAGVDNLYTGSAWVNYLGVKSAIVTCYMNYAGKANQRWIGNANPIKDEYFDSIHIYERSLDNGGWTPWVDVTSTGGGVDEEEVKRIINANAVTLAGNQVIEGNKEFTGTVSLSDWDGIEVGGTDLSQYIEQEIWKETLRAQSAEQNLLISSATADRDTDRVYVNLTQGNNGTRQVELKKRTSEKAGVMLPEDYAELEAWKASRVNVVYSQTQTWASDYSGYTMSNLVRKNVSRDMVDMFVSAGATFNESTGYFELNGLTDISYKEMELIYNYGNINKTSNAPLYSSTIRTNIASIGSRDIWGNQFAVNSKVEVLELVSKGGSRQLYVSPGPGSSSLIANMSNAFNSCYYLKSILCNSILVSAISNANYFVNTFLRCYSLIDVNLEQLRTSIGFPDSSHLSYQSLKYLVDNAANTSAITITLHNDVWEATYGHFSGETFNGGTYDQWTQLALDATAKNISFASA